MKIEQLIQSKSKEEIAFIMYAHPFYSSQVNKVPCLSCPCFEKDDYGTYKCCRPKLEDSCREEFHKWLQSEIEWKP